MMMEQNNQVEVMIDDIGGQAMGEAGEHEALPVDAVADDSPLPVTEPETAARRDYTPAELQQHVEALLMATDRALPASKLGELLGGVGGKPVKDAIESLNASYEKTGRSFRIEEVAGGYQIYTLPEFGSVLASLNRTRAQSKLSPAQMETLAITAYRQPVLRADIEAIRGVSCGEVLRSLMERRLIKIVGRAEELGRPMLYGTTRQFLEVFGLSSLKDLPKAEELRPKEPITIAEPATESAE